MNSRALLRSQQGRPASNINAERVRCPLSLGGGGCTEAAEAGAVPLSCSPSPTAIAADCKPLGVQACLSALPGPEQPNSWNVKRPCVFPQPVPERASSLDWRQQEGLSPRLCDCCGISSQQVRRWSSQAAAAPPTGQGRAGQGSAHSTCPRRPRGPPSSKRARPSGGFASCRPGRFRGEQGLLYTGAHGQEAEHPLVPRQGSALSTLS